MSTIQDRMNSNMMRKFRRNPRVELERIRPATVSGLLKIFFKAFDKRGRLSDVIADPQLVYEAWWPYRFFRRKFGNFKAEYVSVVVATRNNEDTISASLTSIMAQSFRNLQIIVVDDGSTDASPGIIAELCERDPRIRVVTNEMSIGTGASRNLGMRMATGAYLTFQDGDDVSDPTRIERQVIELLRDPAKKVVTCNYVRVNSRRERLEVNEKRVMNCIISMMFPRQDVLDNVGFFREANVSEDSDFFERIKVFFGEGCDTNIFRTLYEAQFREDSSFFSSCENVKITGRRVQFERKKSVVSEWDSLMSQHEQMKQRRVTPYNMAGQLK